MYSTNNILIILFSIFLIICMFNFFKQDTFENSNTKFSFKNRKKTVVVNNASRKPLRRN
jgi:hypothetical protein